MIKVDLVQLFNQLHAENLDIARLNFGEIILLPNTKEVVVFNNIARFAF